MTGFDSKRKIAQDRLDDDDVQVYAKPNLKGKSMTKDEALKLARDWIAEPIMHREPTQQPQVRTGNCLLCGVCAFEGHKIQAKRPWVGLTDNEIMNVFKEKNALKFAAAIEAALKEKNT